LIFEVEVAAVGWIFLGRWR